MVKITTPTTQPTPTRQILSTKLHIPRVRSELVSRPRLTERLNAGLNRVLTLIAAPAGSGKTTLVIEWQQQYGYPLAWVSLDASDNDPSRFLTYLLSALAMANPSLGEQGFAALDSPQPPPVQIILAGVINDLLQCKEQLVLVLDDYHLIDSKGVHDAVIFLIDNLPTQLHLIITSRSDPPLPLARLRGRDLLTEFRADDLRFMPHEGDAFLNQVMGLDLSAADVAALEAQTEGWVAGLQFAALSLRNAATPDVRQRFISTLSGRDRHLVDYLVEEVLQQQSDAVQHFLLHTSILARMCGPLCDALLRAAEQICGGDEASDLAHAQARLEELERANLFIVPLDTERCWYRYHHLFADLLRQRLTRQIGEASVAAFNRAASRWFEQQQLIDEAIDYALAAADFDLAAGFIDEIAHQVLWQQGQFNRIRRWLVNFPTEVVARYPYLVAAGAMALVGTDDQENLTRYLGIAANLPDPPADVQALLTTVETGQLRWRGEHAEAIRRLRAVKACLSPELVQARIVINIELLGAYLEQNELARNYRLLQETLTLAQSAHQTAACVGLLTWMGDVAFGQGHLNKAQQTYQQALALRTADSGLNPAVLGMVYCQMANLSYQWNDLQQAIEYADMAVALCEQGWQGSLLNSYTARIRLYLAVDDIAGAKHQLKIARVRAQLFDFGNFTSQWGGFLDAEIALRSGDLGTIAQWVETSGLAVSDSVEENAHLFDYSLLARYYLAKHEHEPAAPALQEAVALLKRLIARPEPENHVAAIIGDLITLALIYNVQNEAEQALSTLSQALSRAEPGRFIRSFLDGGPALIPLLEQALRNATTPAYTRTLLEAFAREAEKAGGQDALVHSSSSSSDAILRIQSPAPSPQLIEPLTDRELDVLHQISAGQSNQQIADTLIISVNTVRAHIRNIFGKLDVSSRTQASVRARELGLLLSLD